MASELEEKNKPQVLRAFERFSTSVTMQRPSDSGHRSGAPMFGRLFQNTTD